MSKSIELLDVLSIILGCFGHKLVIVFQLTEWKVLRTAWGIVLLFCKEWVLQGLFSSQSRMNVILKHAFYQFKPVRTKFIDHTFAFFYFDQGLLLNVFFQELLKSVILYGVIQCLIEAVIVPQLSKAWHILRIDRAKHTPDLLDCIQLIVSLEYNEAGHKFDEHTGQRPNIHSKIIVSLPKEQLVRSVPQSHNPRSVVICGHHRIENPCQTKVRDSHLTRLG